MSRATRVVLCSLAVLMAGCFHAIITTGKPESTTVVEKQWALSFVYGLVPPDVMDVSAQCKSGVAKVETQHSFLNSLVAIVTFDIVTPMDIKVTCAGTGAATSSNTITVPQDASMDARRLAIGQAAQMVQKSGQAEFVKY